MRSRSAWAGAGGRVAGVVVVLLVAALGVAVPPSGAAATIEDLTTGASLAAVPAAIGPRAAFTDARDAIETAAVTQGDSSAAALDATKAAPSVPPPAPPAPAPVHEGEVSSNEQGQQAFISTRDDPRGDVYFLDAPPPTGPAPSPVRVTCANTATESHPVVSPDGNRIAYATNVSGVFRLRLAVLDPDGAACPSTVYDLAGAPEGADTWPTWLSDQWLGFSSTSNDPLGDIWAEYVGRSDAPVVDQPSVRLTTGGASETQPASIDLFSYSEGTRTILTFTTTQYRADGSLGAMNLPYLASEGTTEDYLDGGGTTVYSPWMASDLPPQSSEGVWFAELSTGAYRLAFTTTDRDPYGDILTVSPSFGEGGAQLALPLPVRLDDDVAVVLGRAETHPAWVPDPVSGRLLVSYTVRTSTANISDVLTADGSGRRVIADNTADLTNDDVEGAVPLDESTPTFSPDGTRMAYSRTQADGNGVGKEIVTANADGSNVVSLLQDQPEASSDLEPAWSPDGTRIAFIRTYPCGECPPGSQVWIANVATRQDTRVTLDVVETVLWDESPSWSPDGTRVVVARTVQTFPDLTTSFSAPSVSVDAGSSVVVALTVTNRGLGAANNVRFTLPPSSGTGDTFTVEPENPSDPSCSFVFDRWACTADNIAAGSDRTWSLRLNGFLAGTHTLTIEPVVNGSPAETDTSNNSVSIPVTVTVPRPDLGVTMTPATATVLSGTTSGEVLTVAVTNDGGPAAGVAVTLTTGGESSLIAVNGPSGCAVAASTITCTLASMAAGDVQSWPLTVTSNSESSTTSGTATITATATVTGPPGDANPADNSAASTVIVLPLGLGLTTLSLKAGPVVAAAWAGAPSPLVVSFASAPGRRASVLPAGIRESPVAPPGDGVSTLWVIDVATRAAHELAAPAADSCECIRTIEGRSPAWSPDGMRIAFEQHGTVRILDLADPRGAAIALTAGAPRVQMVTGFEQEYLREIGAVEIFGAATPSRATISTAEDPAWSPDGAWLLVAGQPAGLADNRGIYRIRPDGTGLTAVAQEPGPETEPAWQPWASLRVTLTTSAPSILVGAAATLTATVTNPGPGTSGATVLVLELPNGLTHGTLPSGCASAAAATGSTLITCQLGSIRPEAPATPTTPPVPVTVTVRIPVTGTAVGSHRVTAAAGSSSPDDSPSDNEATTSITVTAIPVAPEPKTDTSVTVAVAPNPGYVGGSGTVTVVVGNSATGAVTDATVTITLPIAPPTAIPTPTPTTTPPPTPTPTATTPPTTTPRAGTVALVGTAECFTGTPCDLGQIQPGTQRTFTAQVRFATAGTSTITATVATETVADSDSTNDSSSVDLVVRQPVLRLLQSTATPGSVVMAVGTDFPPGSQVTLQWDQGVNSRPVPLTVAADGTIRATQILVFRRDRLAKRDLVAAATEAGLFDPVQDTLLVVPRTAAAPADLVSRS